MDTPWLVPVALLFGAVVGGGLVVLLRAAAHRGERAVSVATAAVPDGVDQVIEILETAGVVLDGSNNVLRASPGAMAFGLVWNKALVHPELVDIVDRVRRTGEPVDEELELARGPFGDASVYLDVRVAMLGSRYVLLLADDRTESYRLEEVRRDFVANISHELKTPIGSIGLLAEALESASDEPEQVKRFAKRMRKEAERLGRLTQEIIELSRLQASDSLDHPEPVALDGVITAAVDQSRVIAESRRIQIVSGGDDGTIVLGDAPMLTMAVHNLVSNAINYSPEGTRVGIGVHARDGIVEIAVTDQGVGIPEEDLDRVFERFFRVDPSRARNTGGTGLGLAIVKHVVQNHGGDIRVWSKAGSGSTFTIRLPEASHASAPALAATSGEPL